MRELDKSEECALKILANIENLFRSDENKVFCNIEIEDLKEGDNFTEFFIGFLKAGRIFMSRTTDKKLNNFDFAQMLVQLSVQDLLRHERRSKRQEE